LSPTEFIYALTWRDALDFGLLVLLSYSLLRLLRGTRVIPILLSVAFFAALGFVARTLDLVAVAELLRYFLEYVIIILIVVFHQELRRFLLRMGQRLLPGGRRQAAESAVGELLTAVERLKRARIGALFILEGELDVAEVCSDAGREVDAPMKADTLVALCVPHSVNLAHDGAILVQDFHIARAALICPLSQREDLDPRFGTRHRGALGVSEETDALVIVCSEERGEVRAVEGGFITAPLERAELEDVILAWLDRPPPRKDDDTDAPSTTQIRMSKAAVGAGDGDEDTAAQSGLRVVAGDDGEGAP
jgi:uncharacterized protein (TIGR00159 family)